MPKLLALGVDVNFPKELQLQRQEWLSSLYPNTSVVVRAISHGPAYLESSFDQALAGRAILEETILAEQDGFDAVGLLCLSDPYLDACREAVRIPVVGAGQASFLIGATLASRLSVVTVNDGAIPLLWKVVMASGISENLISSIRAINMSIAEMTESSDKTLSRLEEVSKRALEEDQAQAIVLGCTEMGRDIQQKLSNRLRVPVVDPNVATVAIALGLVGAKLAQSPRGFPPRSHTLEERYINRCQKITTRYEEA